MAKRKNEMLDGLADLLPKQSRPNWLDRVPADLLEEMTGIKQGFLEGTLPGKLAGASRTGLSHAITLWMAARGISVHESTVDRWLRK